MPKGIYVRTVEILKKQSRLGKHFTQKGLENLRESHKGQIAWNKGVKGMKSPFLGKHHSEESKRKNREKHIGNKYKLGKGHKTPARILIRESNKYKIWRQLIYLRDDFTCQDCGQRGGKLEAHHHKKSFSLLIKEACDFLPLLSIYDAVMTYSPFWDIDNGKTLCRGCHDKTKPGRPKNV
jgi:5-methylcytosine-specific restriction endonuclease McrA